MRTLLQNVTDIQTKVSQKGFPCFTKNSIFAVQSWAMFTCQPLDEALSFIRFKRIHFLAQKKAHIRWSFCNVLFHFFLPVRQPKLSHLMKWKLWRHQLNLAKTWSCCMTYKGKQQEMSSQTVKEQRKCMSKTSAEIVSEARQSLRVQSTKRPFTPRDEHRHLFGEDTVRASHGNRPPSSFRFVSKQLQFQ